MPFAIDKLRISHNSLEIIRSIEFFTAHMGIVSCPAAALGRSKLTISLISNSGAELKKIEFTKFPQ